MPSCPVPCLPARILLIDDDEQLRRMLRHALERSGYAVVEAQNGVEGLRLFKESPVDLVITDILMPEKEGLETIVELLRACPTVKIIAMTGGGRTGHLDFLAIAGKLGAHHALRKPFSLQELVNLRSCKGCIGS